MNTYAKLEYKKRVLLWEYKALDKYLLYGVDTEKMGFEGIDKAYLLERKNELVTHFNALKEDVEQIKPTLVFQITEYKREQIPTSFETLIKHDKGYTFEVIDQTLGREYLKGVISVEFLELIVFFSEKNTLATSVLSRVIDLCIGTYPHWTILDLRLLVHLACTKQLNHNYSKMTGETLMTWCKSYNERRDEAYSLHQACEYIRYKEVGDNIYRENLSLMEQQALERNKKQLKTLKTQR